MDGYQEPAHIIIFLHSSDPILCLDLEGKKKNESAILSTSFLEVEVLNLCRELMVAKRSLTNQGSSFILLDKERNRG